MCTCGLFGKIKDGIPGASRWRLLPTHDGFISTSRGSMRAVKNKPSFRITIQCLRENEKFLQIYRVIFHKR